MNNELSGPILDWLRDHAILHTSEPSFKLSQAGLSSERGLFGFSKHRLGQDPDQALLAFSQQLGMPAELLADYRAALKHAGYVGFGYEGDAGVRRYKAYLDFSSQNAPAARLLLGSNDSALQFLGYKWCIAGNARPVMTEYRAYPLLTRRAMRRRALQLLGDLSAAKTVIESAFSACARDWPERPLEYMEAREPGNPRLSFDVKFYSTSLNISGILPELRRLSDQLGLGPAAQNLLTANAESRLGHLAGGLDRSGTPFLMVYHGVKRRVSLAPQPC
jgi:hypothetical protein